MEGVIGEIRGFASNFAPRGWGLCEGQLLAISSNTALFSILGTTYGGDGRTTFKLPDLRGRAPVSQGTGPGLATKNLGAMSGQEDVTLTNLTLAAHTHFAQYAPSGSGSIGGSATAQMKVSSDNDAGDEPAGTYLGKNDGGGLYASATGARMDANAITVDTSGLTVDTSGMGGTVNLTPTGVGQSHNNMQPYEVINWIVCMIGVYPSRS